MAPRDDLTALVQAHRIGHLATADHPGTPHLVPICFVYDGHAIYSAIDHKPKRRTGYGMKRIRNILENPRVAFLVHHYEEDWQQLSYVLIRGTASVLESGPEHQRALKAGLPTAERTSMDFALSEQQQLMRTEVRHLARQFAWSYWRELDRTSAYPHEFFNAFAAAGWLGTVIPTAYGGSGLGVTEACIVLGEIAASGAGTSGASPIHFSMFPPMPIIKYGSEAMKQRYLPKIASGEMKLAFSVTEPNVGSDTTQLQTTAVRDGDEWVINGRKVWSSNAQQADRVLILTRTTPVARSAKKSKGMSLFFAPMDRSAITIKLIEKMGRHAVDSNELFIDNLRVSHADLVGQEGEGFSHIIAGLNPERIVIAAEAVGIGKAALEKAVQYAKERVVFGRPIGQNQGIQFPLAEAYARLEAAELMTFKAAWLYDQGLPCGKEANIAKLLAGDAGCDAVDHAVQTFGGFGYAREFDVERLYREIRLYKIAPISQQMVLNYLGEHVLGMPRSY